MRQPGCFAWRGRALLGTGVIGSTIGSAKLHFPQSMKRANQVLQVEINKLLFLVFHVEHCILVSQ